MNMRKRWLALPALVAIVASSCSSGGPSTEAETDVREEARLAAEEQTYLEAAGAAETIRGDAYREVFDALGQSYPLPGRFLQVIREADFETANAEALQAAENIEPPERFSDEHKDWLGRLRTEQDLSRDVSEAIDREDVLGVVFALMDIELDFGEGVARWSEPFCRATVQEFGGGEERVCPRGDSIPGGEYGRQLHGILLRLATEIEPRIAIPPILDEEETFAWLSAVQPDVERVFGEMREQVSDLDPPSDLEEDHALILTYLDGIGDVARRITEAADEEDEAALRPLFNESGSVVDRAAAGLSDTARPIVGKFFEEPRPRG